MYAAQLKKGNDIFIKNAEIPTKIKNITRNKDDYRFLDITTQCGHIIKIYDGAIVNTINLKEIL